MLRVALFVAVIFLGIQHVARADDVVGVVRDQNLQLQRYGDMIRKLQDSNQQLMSEMRAVERKYAGMEREIQAANGRSQDAIDDMQNLRNTDLRNVVAAQRQLNAKVYWGDAKRGCPDIKADHQQVKMVMKADGSGGTRYVCFDGKAISIGSESFAAPGQ